MLLTAVSVLLAAVTVSVVILVHELGHFLAARAAGVRVEVFSIGFGTKIVAFRKGPTEYRLSVFPLGGYLKMAGELAGDGRRAPDEFLSKTPGQRAMIFGAGVAFNVLFALAAFIVAFSVGVPFEVAQIGSFDENSPAWRAGLQVGDRIVRIGDRRIRDWQDVVRTAAFSKGSVLPVEAERDGGRRLYFEVAASYDKEFGIRTLGFAPPYRTVVTGLLKIDGRGGLCPAEEAGIRLGDQIIAVGGRKVETAGDIARLMEHLVGPEVDVAVLRGTRTMTFRVRPEPRYLLGISGASAQVEALQQGGRAEEAGLCVGDRITRFNGIPVTSVAELGKSLGDHAGPLSLVVERNGAAVGLKTDLPDADAVDEFLSSLQCVSGNELTWVREDGPAWKAAMRPGDRIVRIAGNEVKDWSDVLVQNGLAGRNPRVVEWVRGTETLSAAVTPEPDLEAGGNLGVQCRLHLMQKQRYSVTESVVVGLRKTVDSVLDVALMIRGFASRQVSTKQLGGVALIAYSSYDAARKGPGRLLYFAGIISVALAVMNVLPIPVLDGGHLMFLLIEKIRGRPVSERILAVCQYAGLALLVCLMLYAFWNDFVRFFGGVFGLA
jgi:regulator of sigma E protease